MKVILLFIGLFLLTQNPFVDETTDWKTNYDVAVKLAKKSNKKVLVYFTGSDWCGPCKALKKDLFETKAFEQLSENYVLLYIDIPRNKDLLSTEQMAHNKELLKKLNKKGVFPLFIALNNKGKVLDEYSGYSMNGDVRYHLSFLEKNK